MTSCMSSVCMTYGSHTCGEHSITYRLVQSLSCTPDTNVKYTPTKERKAICPHLTKQCIQFLVGTNGTN